jgi:hypothetical protein
MHKILGVTPEGKNFAMNLSAPFFQQRGGANVVLVPTGWASMGLFQYPGSHAAGDFNGWVFNAGTVGWTNGLDPSNLSPVSKITLNILRKLGAQIIEPRIEAAQERGQEPGQASLISTVLHSKVPAP